MRSVKILECFFLKKSVRDVICRILRVSSTSTKGKKNRRGEALQPCHFRNVAQQRHKRSSERRCCRRYHQRTMPVLRITPRWLLRNKTGSTRLTFFFGDIFSPFFSLHVCYFAAFHAARKFPGSSKLRGMALIYTYILVPQGTFL